MTIVRLVPAILVAGLALPLSLVVAQEPDVVTSCAPTWTVGERWTVETFQRVERRGAAPLVRGPRLPGFPVLHDGVPEGWKRANTWRLEVLRREAGIAPNGSRSFHVISLANEHGPSRRSELWFDARDLRLARVCTGFGAASRTRWLRGPAALELDESRWLAFPLDWPSWSGRERVELELVGVGVFTQTREPMRSPPGSARIRIDRRGGTSPTVVMDWIPKRPWWQTYRSETVRAELVAHDRPAVK